MRSLRNPNRMPTHPGAVLREDVLPELGWTQTELAARLMVSRQTVSDLLHERKSVTAEMAIRIARAVGGTPESWLRMQERRIRSEDEGHARVATRNPIADIAGPCRPARF